MGQKNIYERFIWFDDRVRAKAYPNATSLAEKFEISSKTTQRDVEFMRCAGSSVPWSTTRARNEAGQRSNPHEGRPIRKEIIRGRMRGGCNHAPIRSS